MNIEEVAENTPHLVYKEWIDPHIGLQDFQKRNIAFNLGLEGNAYKEFLSSSQIYIILSLDWTHHCLR